MRSHGTSPIRPSCCKMDWSEQADGTWLRGCAASTGATRSWAVGLSCPPPSPFSSQSTRPSTTKTHCSESMTSTVDTLKAEINVLNVTEQINEKAGPCLESWHFCKKWKLCNKYKSQIFGTTLISFYCIQMTFYKKRKKQMLDIIICKELSNRFSKSLLLN